MTTTVKVTANHGWPVRVTEIHTLMDGTEARTDLLVPAAEERVLAVWDGKDLLIHEIQPREAQAQDQPA